MLYYAVLAFPDSSPLTHTMGPKQTHSVANASSKCSPSWHGIQKDRMPLAKCAKFVLNSSKFKSREQDSTLSPFLCATLDILFEVHIQHTRPVSHDPYPLMIHSHTTGTWVRRTRRPTYTCTHLLAATAPAVVARYYVHLEERTPKVWASA
jgi:hypothetical protein